MQDLVPRRKWLSDLYIGAVNVVQLWDRESIVCGLDFFSPQIRRPRQFLINGDLGLYTSKSHPSHRASTGGTWCSDWD